MRHFPLFLDLNGRRVLIVGAREAAAHKVHLARSAGAEVIFRDPARDAFDAEDLRECTLAFVCGASEEMALRVSAAAKAMGVPVNVQDRADLSTFIMPAILDREPVTIAVSTGGASPMLARMIRDFVGAALPRGIGRMAAVLADFRREAARRIPSFGLRRRFWEFVGVDIFDGVASGGETGLRRRVRHLLDGFDGAARSPVYLVGAGPGDPGLLTVRALRVLQLAEVVLYDRLVDERVVDCIGPGARRVCVGKAAGAASPGQDEINLLMAELASAGRRVVRLKSGDPFVFGRGGEEIEYLARRGLRVEVVPGITAALGCAAYAGIPLTHRDCASAVTFVSARGAHGGEPDLDWAGLAAGGQTLVVYMGVEAAALVTRRLVENGSDPETPVAVIENGTRPDQKLAIGTLGGLAELIAENQIRSPALIIVGAVVRLRSRGELREPITRFRSVCDGATAW